MLGKLMKYELRATARLMLPLLLLVMLFGAGIGIGSHYFGRPTELWLSNLLNLLFVLGFVVSITASAVCSVVLMVQRFSKNLMADEGYLMFTLPVGHHRLILSKLLTSIIWFFAVAIVDILAVLLAIWSGDLPDLTMAIGDNLRYLLQNFTGKTLLVGSELLLFAVLSGAITCLQFYAAIAVGHSFAQHKTLYSVVTFFVLAFVHNFLSGTLIGQSAQMGFWNLAGIKTFDAVWRSVQTMIGATLAYNLVIAAVLYVLTWLMTKKRLNLQ